MRIFQNSGISPSYRARLAGLVAGVRGFEPQKQVFLNDRYGAAHILLPVLAGSPETFFTNGDDKSLQRAWALENGLGEDASLADILLAQIEHHKTDIFYNLDPYRYEPLSCDGCRACEAKDCVACCARQDRFFRRWSRRLQFPLDAKALGRAGQKCPGRLISFPLTIRNSTPWLQIGTGTSMSFFSVATVAITSAGGRFGSWR